jgi:hypothetical protein
MNINRRSVFAICAILILAPAATLRAATPPAKPGASPLQPAITALLKEYQASLPEKGAALREKCDYFAQARPEGLTPEVVVAALEKPVSTDPRAEAYVKWQLLSGVDGKFAEPLKARVINVYRRAPVPGIHPGADRTSLERLLNRVGITKAEAEPDINKEFGEVITKYRLQIEPILAYRDELYARLPPGYDTLVAGLSDVYDRVSHGAPANEFWTTVSAGVRSWALTSNDARQMQQLAAAIDKLQAFVKDEKHRPYYRVMWAKEDKYTGLKWIAESTIQNDKSMADLALWLDEHSKNPGSGLNFKDSEDMKKK